MLRTKYMRRDAVARRERCRADVAAYRAANPEAYELAYEMTPNGNPAKYAVNVDARWRLFRYLAERGHPTATIARVLGFSRSGIRNVVAVEVAA